MRLTFVGAANPMEMNVASAARHSILDSTSGASVATLYALASMSVNYEAAQAFCSTHGDSPTELLPEEWLAESGLYYKVTQSSHFSMIHTESRGVRIDMFRTESTCRRWTGPDEIRRFLAACHCSLESYRPNVLITYGGDEVSAVGILAALLTGTRSAWTAPQVLKIVHT